MKNLENGKAQIQQYFLNLKGLGGLRLKRVQMLLTILGMNPWDAPARGQLQKIIHYLEEKRKTLVPFFPVPWECDTLGNRGIKLGRIIGGDGSWYSIGLNNFFKKIFVAGSTGSGKTTLGYVMLEDLLPMLETLKCTVWIFDFKRDYSALIKKYPKSVWVIKGDTMLECLAEPPEGVAPSVYATWFPKTIGQIYWWETPSENMVTETLQKKYENISGRWPNLYDILQGLESKTFKFNDVRNNYRQRAIDRITGLINTLGPSIASCVESYSFKKLQEPGKAVVFSLHMFNETEKAFITLHFAIKLLLQRLVSADRNYTNVIIWNDEAFILFSKNYLKRLQEVSLLVNFMHESREFFVGNILFTQSPSSIIPDVLNSDISVSFFLREGNDKAAILNSIGWDGRYIDKYPFLKPQIAMVSDSAFGNPFLIKVPDKLIDKNVTDFEIDTIMEPRLKLLGGKLLDQSPSELLPAAMEKPSIIKIPEEIKKFLMKLHLRPEPVSSICKQIGISEGEGMKRIVKFIENTRLAVFHGISTGLRGGQPLIGEITEAGCAAIGVQYVPQRGRGSGFIHWYWQQVIKEYLKNYSKEASVHTEVEKEYCGIHPDLWCEIQGKRIAFEVSLTTTADNELSNSIKDLSVFDSVVVCFDSKEKLTKVKNYILENILEQDKNRIKFVILGEFLKANESILDGLL